MSERDPRFVPQERQVPVEPAGVVRDPASTASEQYPETHVVTQGVPVLAPVYDPRPERIVWLITAVVDVLLAMRFIFELLGASTQSAFVALLYGVTLPLVGPFLGIFGTPSGQGYVFEPGALVALIVYTLIAWAIVALIRIRHSRRRPPP